MKPAALRAIAAAIAAYSGVIVVWFACLLLLRDGWWLLILVNFAVVEPMIPALPLLLCSFFVQSRRLSALAAVPVLIFGFLYWPYLVPDFSTRSSADWSESDRIRVMTYNILNDNDDVDAVTSVIDRYQPDVVAIQELTETMEPRLIAALAGSHPHHAVATPRRGGTTALFSQTPLDDLVEVDFGIDRPALMATTDVGDQRVIVASAHLNPSYYALQESSPTELPGALQEYLKDQNSQAEQLVAALLARSAETGRPIILGCDCNTRENNRTNRIFSAELIDPTRSLGWPLRRPTLPGTQHERRISHIDYIWYRDGAERSLEVGGIYRVIDRGGSDHHPLVADFGLSPVG